MSFRRKLLILLFVVGLTPLLINGLLHRATLQRISEKLTTETRETLQENAIEQLQSLVHHQSLLLQRDRAFILQSIIAQTREIEKILARNRLPADSELTATYLSIQRTHPDYFLWHATFLKSGQKSVFPQKALSSDQKADLQKQSRQIKTIVWQLSLVNSRLQITVYSPIYFLDGILAGVTAITLDHQQFFKDWQLPQLWAEHGRLFVVTIDSQATDSIGTLKILVEILDHKEQRTGDLNPQRIFDVAVTASSREKLVRELENNYSGFLALEFNGIESTWVYSGSTTKGEPFPLLIIPNGQVNLPANQAADFVERQFIGGLKQTALLSFSVLLCVAMIAIFRARAVTRPVAMLVQSAERLSKGDFTTSVKISSNDEFEELGRAFNQIGPHLKERQEIKQALASAKDIQQLILPKTAPRIKHFDLFGRLDYCDEIGGDYYDFIETTAGKWCLLVGDVVGHGVGAALLMASAAGILHAAIVNGEEDLDTLFTMLNRFLVKDVGDTRFMTLFAALLDPSDRSLTWLSAGHGPVYLYRAASNRVEELSPVTMPLGIMEAVEFQPVRKETLSSGDILAIGTDGIWEATDSDNEMFGSSQVSHMLKDLSKETAEDIVSRILHAVDEFCDSAPPKDDRALIILKVLGGC